MSNHPIAIPFILGLSAVKGIANIFQNTYKRLHNAKHTQYMDTHRYTLVLTDGAKSHGYASNHTSKCVRTHT